MIRPLQLWEPARTEIEMWQEKGEESVWDKREAHHRGTVGEWARWRRAALGVGQLAQDSKADGDLLFIQGTMRK